VPQTTCPACGGTYHSECWEFNQGCAVYGCENVPPVEARTALEIAPAWWGREHKDCPCCGRSINAAAIRCRNCGLAFETAAPLAPEDLVERCAQAAGLVRLRRHAVWLLALGVLPFTAPLAAVFGGLWWVGNRSRLPELTGMPAAAWRIGLAVACLQTALGMLIIALRSSGPD
jgi:hypothetical protein